ncbi:MAG: peptidase [Gammaproteobacteria bacterium]
MTYCLAIRLDEGLVLTSDSRTNAGIDQVSTYSKMHTFGIDGERQFVLLSAGNLATTQAVVNRLERDIADNAEASLNSVEYLSQAAEYLGEINRNQASKFSDAVVQGDFNPEATFLLGGQIGAQPPAIYLIYPQGNYISASAETPFLLLGESKYGKPILDRIITPATSLQDAVHCSLVSMDSTMRSNATVGPPIEIMVYVKDSLRLDHRLRLDADDPYLLQLKKAWDKNLKQAFVKLPKLDWRRNDE